MNTVITMTYTHVLALLSHGTCIWGDKEVIDTFVEETDSLFVNPLLNMDVRSLNVPQVCIMPKNPTTTSNIVVGNAQELLQELELSDKKISLNILNTSIAPIIYAGPYETDPIAIFMTSLETQHMVLFVK